jgi:hypothetical protein
MAKLLKDGTAARKGMVVVVLKGVTGGNDKGAVVKITNILRNDDSNESYVKCSSPWGDMYENISDLRVATKEERATFNKGKK